MALSVDPDIAAVLAVRAKQAIAAGVVMPARGDALALRALTDPGLELTFAQAGPAPDVSYAVYETTGGDGAAIKLRWYTRSGDQPGSAVAYIHGGGMICGSIGHYDPLVRQYVQWTGVPFLSVEYRLAPEYPGETPARDSLAGVRWLLEHAAELGVDPGRIAIMGDSGGGVGAGAAILARDFAGLAPAYIEVGTLDIFRDESISYAQRLLQAGVDAELHVHRGGPHGYDWSALHAPLATRWKADRIRVLTAI